ncbi:GTPase [Rhodococcus artemisiae]|uniref:GTPase n=1 Tax=Rhodococcus artemisiae TaxID=714159 RepID=A0ABU7LE72_9NOCA|nr:GTPase [Rhodococcus artemisiae]
MHQGGSPQRSNDPVHARIESALHSLANLGGDLPSHASRIGAILFSPPRIVVVGRLKAGKSTLVNALIGAPLAETAALEATNVVTVYSNGAPSRAEVVKLDGSVVPQPLSFGGTVAPAFPPTEIAYVQRFLPSQSLSDITLIDTPGLATLTVDNAATTRRALIDGYEQTRTASVDADAAIFLFDSAPRADEVDFLHQLGFTPLTTLGVLSRADGFGEGALGRRDPLAHAAGHAAVLAAQLPGLVGSVIPVAGLLAETSHTGRLTETDARALRSLAGPPGGELFDIIDVGDPMPVDPPTVERLLDLVGEYGLVHGRQVATGGAHALGAWLTERSGIGRLREVLHTSLREYAVLQRAGRILQEIDSLAYSHPARDHIRSIAYALENDPALTPVLLLRALRALLRADPSAPLVAELADLLRGRTFAERLRLPASAPPGAIRDAAAQRLAAVQQRTLTASTAAEDAALTVLTRAYTTIWRTHS